MEYQSPLSMLYHWEKETPNKVYLKQPVNGVWHTWTWKQTANEVRQLGEILMAKQLPQGSQIAMISKNCAHWIIADLAIMMAGHTSVPLYPNLQATSIRQILIHSEAKLLLVGKLDDWDSIKEGVPERIQCIALPFCSHDRCDPWKCNVNNELLSQKSIDRKESDTASIVYTSGTTGLPKGVMFTFESFSFAAQHAKERLSLNTTDRFFSYLPLSHIAERMLVEMISLYAGAEVSFAESIEKFPANLAEAKPTVFLGVHRIWTKFQQGVLSKIPQKKLDVLLKIPIISSIVKNKIKRNLGLSQANTVLTGAAPTPESLLKWYNSIGIKIQEAYAMTENCCYSHVTLNKKIKVGFVGQPLPHCEVKLGENDEIQIKHKALMSGYFKDLDMSKAAFTDDGFLKTGDEGYIDSENFLKITGRVKDIFKTAKGKYVAPSPIEMKFSINQDIEQVCVVGSGLPQPIALVTISEKGRKRKAEEVSEDIKVTLKNINSTLDSHEKVDKVLLLKDEWTIENNLLTPSFKIKRNEIEKKYTAFFDTWLSCQSDVIWK